MSDVAEIVGDGIPQLMLFCEPCDRVHIVPYEGSNKWDWNGSLVSPTLSPSILVQEYPGHQPLCHSFVQDGFWDYLSDCTHAAAGTRRALLPRSKWPY